VKKQVHPAVAVIIILLVVCGLGYAALMVADRVEVPAKPPPPSGPPAGATPMALPKKDDKKDDKKGEKKDAKEGAAAKPAKGKEAASNKAGAGP
jgi:hypothetical protein